MFPVFESRLSLTLRPLNFSQLLLRMIGEKELFFRVSFFFQLCNAITGIKSLQYYG